MDIKTLKRVLPVMKKAGITLLLVGHKGVGKSASIKQYTQENKIGFIDLRLGQMSDVGDIMGLPQIIDGKTCFMKPEFFPTEGEGIILLDEINRAPKDILQAVFQLVYDKRINTYKLPEGWQVVAVMNPATDEYDVLDFQDFAFADRFCQVKLIPNFKDYLDYLKSKKTDSTLVDFLTTNSTMLKKELSNFDLNVHSGERSWDRVGDLLKHSVGLEKEVLVELISGMVGTEAALAYINFAEDYKMEVSADEVLDNYKEVKEKVLKISQAESLRADILNKLNDDLVEKLNQLKMPEHQKENFVAYLRDLPTDITVGVFTKLINNVRNVSAKENIDIANYKPLAELIAEIREKSGIKHYA